MTVEHVHLGNADDCDGVLVYCANVLVAVLSHLSFGHGENAGRWYVEYCFGVGLEGHQDFETLQDACDWIEDRIEKRDREAADASERRTPKR